MADTLEMKPKDVTALLKQVLPSRKSLTRSGGVSPKRQKQSNKILRFRLMHNALIVEAVKVEASGKRRVLKSVRVKKTVEKKKARPSYASLRAEFEAAAAEHRVAPEVLAAHQKQNAGAIADYWKQTPAE